MATDTLRDVKKNFGPTGVIHGISTEIEDGEFIVIVDLSGCGKPRCCAWLQGLKRFHPVRF